MYGVLVGITFGVVRLAFVALHLFTEGFLSN